MTLEERIAQAIAHAIKTQNKKGKDLAGEIGVSPTWISTLRKGGGGLGADKLWPLAKACSVRPEWIATGNGPMLANSDDGIRYVPYYSPQKNAEEATLRSQELCPVTKKLMRGIQERSKLVAYNALDDSMSPTIAKDDVVLIDTAKNSPDSGNIYAISMPNGQLILRRFVQNFSGAWIIRADNLDKIRYPDEKVESLLHLAIAGRAVSRIGPI